MAEPTSTKPYLLRALYEWCVDNGLTPYISVLVDPATKVPHQYVRNGEIVLNIGPLATQRLKMGDDVIELAARFGGVARELAIPVGRVAAIYARENGQGMSFEVDRLQAPPAHDDQAPTASPPRTEEAASAESAASPAGGKSGLRVVK